MANEALVFPEGSSHSSPERLPRHPILENCDHTFGVGVKIDMAEPTTDFAVWNRNERSSGRGRCACFNRRAASGYRSLAVCERLRVLHKTRCADTGKVSTRRIWWTGTRRQLCRFGPRQAGHAHMGV